VRPTLWQLYCDPSKIIEALEAQGVRNAHARVMGLMSRLTEYWSMSRYLKRLSRDRDNSLSEVQRIKDRITKDQRNPRKNLWDLKQASRFHITMLNARAYLSSLGGQLEKRIAKWPDLDLDPKSLRRRPTKEAVERMVKKRRKKARTKTGH
jgi:hypothetical protein